MRIQRVAEFLFTGKQLMNAGRMNTLATAPKPVREELPPSCKLVWACFDDAGELTQADVVEYTKLPERTAREALQQLEAAGVITSRPDLRDTRVKIYEPA
jgi:DNA-binding MarR family transcriptional regulator